VLGRTMFDIIEHTTTPAVRAKQSLVPFRAVNGG
jgi:hypothetical protein